MPVTWRCSGVAHAAFVSQISFYVYLCHHLYDHVRVSQEYEGYGRFIGKQAMVYFWPCRVHFSFSKGKKKEKAGLFQALRASKFEVGWNFGICSPPLCRSRAMSWSSLFLGL